MPQDNQEQQMSIAIQETVQAGTITAVVDHSTMTITDHEYYNHITQQIVDMNKTYELDVLYTPTLHPDTPFRLDNFESILKEEIKEFDDIHASFCDMGKDHLDILTQIADLLADLYVYIHSEAVKYGIPFEDVVRIVMASNRSKLGENGKPIKDERDKFLKGPNYWKPEPAIRKLLENRIAEAKEQQEQEANQAHYPHRIY